MHGKHWAYAKTLRKTFAKVPVIPERVLVAAGERRHLISSGASTSWHDLMLMLYLISRRAGAAATLAIARLYALQWHGEGLAPYIVFQPPREYDDAVVPEAQDTLSAHHSSPSPVQDIVTRSGPTERTFKRRFSKATGLPTTVYVQHLRIEEATRRLENT